MRFSNWKLSNVLAGLFLSTLIVGCGIEIKTKPQASSAGNTTQDESAMADNTPAPQPAPPEMERVKAGVGVGKKGRRLDQDHVVDAIAQPAKSLFAAKERIAYDIAVRHALDLYKATNGHPPQSHEEFMEKIVKFNQIQLPELPEGHRYVYDPERGELMVERPKAQPANP